MDDKTLTTTPPDPGSKRFEVKVQRRNFLGIAAMASFTASWLAGILGALRLPVPAVFPEANPRFRIGGAEQYAKGSATRIRGRNVWIFHDDEGFFAISAVCTHLGCIVDREGTEFSCPCHGSKFDANGLVKSGPAPGRLPWLEIGLDPSGDLYVDSESSVPQGTRFVV